jgi:NADH dehydrogenase
MIDRRGDMNVLVTGGTGVIGEGLIPRLLRDGHSVRMLSRAAAEDIRKWSGEIRPFPADITRADELRGAADRADVVVHITGIVEERPPEITFQKVNVEGTRNIVEEAIRSGVPRFIYISSLGANRGKSDYHLTKFSAEEIVRGFPGDWLILRPGTVYGPGDEIISTLMTMNRTFPAIPIIGGGDQKFQPIWYEDLGEAIARAVSSAPPRQVLAMAGRDVTTTVDLLDRIAAITGRDPLRIPIPSAVVGAGTEVAESLGMTPPVNEAKLTMLLEENVVLESDENGLTKVFGIEPTPLDTGLRRLADEMPEQLPSDGVGDLVRKRYWAEIEGAHYSAENLLRLFRERIVEIMPIDFAAEPGGERRIEKGATVTGSLPLRGNFQMRVEEVSERRITLATVQGHPIAGVVRFGVEGGGSSYRFEITIYARAASGFDWLALNTFVGPAQDANWETVVGRVVELSGGIAPEGVRHDREVLDEVAAGRVESWIADLVLARNREERAAAARR